MVVVDSAPLLPVADSIALASRTDATIVVARANTSRAPDVASAVSVLRRIGADIAGCLLNEVKRSPTDGYDSYHSYSRSDEQSARARPSAPTVSRQDELRSSPTPYRRNAS